MEHSARVRHLCDDGLLFHTTRKALSVSNRLPGQAALVWYMMWQDPWRFPSAFVYETNKQTTGEHNVA